MQKLITIWFLSFFFLQMTQANNHPLSLNPTNSETADDYSCNLNPPSSFYPISVGTHNVLLGWSAVSGASSYEIEASIGGVPVGPAISVPNNYTSYDYDGLPSGTTVDFQIWSICNNGQRSSANAATSATTVVIELIAQTIQDCIQGGPVGNGIIDFSNSSSGTIAFNFYDNTQIWGELSKGGAPALTFRITLPNTVSNTDIFTIDPVSPLQPGYNLCITSSNSSCENAGYGGELKIKLGTTLLANATFTKPGIGNPSQQPAQGSIKLSSLLSSSHTFRLLTKTCNNGGAEGGNISRSDLSITGTVNNPFHDLLIYNCEILTEDDVTLSLLDMNGRILRTQKMAGGQDQYSLQTADITPGMYVLRVQTGKQVKVLQVVKTN